MIYQVLWYLAAKRTQNCSPGWAVPKDIQTNAQGLQIASVDMQEYLAKRIKESPKDSFVFIIQKESVFYHSGIETFQAFLKDFDLESYVALEAPFVTNPVHANRGRNLKLFVLQTPKT